MQPAELQAIMRTWVHSHEEDTPQGQVYRPDDTELPPARGRNRLDLLPAGNLTELRPGANDVPQEHAGGWQVTNDNRLIINLGEHARVFKIVSLAKDRLVLKKES